MKPSHLNQFFRDSLATRSGSTSARGMKNSSPMWPFLRTRLASLAPRAFSSSSSQAARAAVASLTARAAASRSTDALGAPGSPAPAAPRCRPRRLASARRAALPPLIRTARTTLRRRRASLPLWFKCVASLWFKCALVHTKRKKFGDGLRASEVLSNASV